MFLVFEIMTNYSQSLKTFPTAKILNNETLPNGWKIKIILGEIRFYMINK